MNAQGQTKINIAQIIILIKVQLWKGNLLQKMLEQGAQSILAKAFSAYKHEW